MLAEGDCPKFRRRSYLELSEVRRFLAAGMLRRAVE